MAETAEMAEMAEMLRNEVPIHNQAQPTCQTPLTNKPHPCKSLTEQIYPTTRINSN